MFFGYVRARTCENTHHDNYVAGKGARRYEWGQYVSVVETVEMQCQAGGGKALQEIGHAIGV